MWGQIVSLGDGLGTATRADRHALEQANERRVVHWLGAIACLSISAAVALVATADKSSAAGIETAVIVAMIGVATACVSSLGTRRTRTDPQPAGPTVGPPPMFDPAPPDGLAADLLRRPR